MPTRSDFGQHLPPRHRLAYILAVYRYLNALYYQF